MFLLKTHASVIVLFFISAAAHANEASCQAQQSCGEHITK